MISIPGLGLGLEGNGIEGNGNPLQYFSLGNPMDRGAWQTTVHGVTKESDRTLRLKQEQRKPKHTGSSSWGKHLTQVGQSDPTTIPYNNN